MRVLFTPSAENHFLSALAYIRRENPSAAQSLRDRAHKSLSRLLDFPESGRHIPEFPDLPYREVLVPPYRFFYRVREDTVWIVDVWHDAQIPGEPLE